EGREASTSQTGVSEGYATRHLNLRFEADIWQQPRPPSKRTGHKDVIYPRIVKVKDRGLRQTSSRLPPGAGIIGTHGEDAALATHKKKINGPWYEGNTSQVDIGHVASDIGPVCPGITCHKHLVAVYDIRGPPIVRIEHNTAHSSSASGQR